VMMPSASPWKVERTRGLGGEVVFCEDHFESRTATVREIAEDEGRTVVHPYDHPHVVAGNGTAALEILEDGDHLQRILVPISGGGLIAGIATATALLDPAVEVWGVQPEGSNATYLSFQQGKPVSISRADTIADGLRVTRPGDFTFPLIQQHVSRVVTVSEDSIRHAVARFFSDEKLVVEPSGAVTLAAVLEDRAPAQGTVCVISGGNVAPDDFCSLVETLNRP
ncbi:MAG: pyridoxal-phosphate dependent enzyme, partial [Phycisphaeraceae bacterium]|nr:pyridoxal-phosphate dependent enzyme [Phycisphaeraceae bacterium]